MDGVRVGLSDVQFAKIKYMGLTYSTVKKFCGLIDIVVSFYDTTLPGRTKIRSRRSE